MTISNEARTVCILTPGSIGSNPRVVKEADVLEAAGYRIRVIATRTLERIESRDEALMRRIRWELERIDLRSNSLWRLRRLPQLAARGLFAASGHSGFATAAFSPFTAVLTLAALRTPADLYIAHYPAALPAAVAAARAHGARYAYDAEDFHLGDWPEEPNYDTDRKLARAIEGRFLHGCAYVTAASPGIADAYVEAYGIERPTVVLNVFPLTQAPDKQTAKGSAEPGPSLYWFSQTIGPDRGLECAVEAISIARSRPHLYLRGTLASGYFERLDALAARCGVSGKVHYLPPGEPDEMERLAAVYDLGLIAETGHTPARRVCLTNKLFSFLLAGVPPLMSDTPAHVAFIAEAGIHDQLFPTGDAAALAQLIDNLLSPEHLDAARRKAWQLARERYNWEKVKGELVRVTHDALACTSTTHRSMEDQT
jgi:glycosyltransferase involved in cell wall biosynthesis